MAGQFFCDEEVKISLCSEVLTTNTHYSMFNTTFIAWSPQRVLLFSILKIHFLQTCWQEIRCVCRRLLEFSTTAHPTTASTTPPTTATTTSTPISASSYSTSFTSASFVSHLKSPPYRISRTQHGSCMASHWPGARVGRRRRGRVAPWCCPWEGRRKTSLCGTSAEK